MDDATINRLVAERVMGHAVYGGFTWTLPDKALVCQGVPDYCATPAAWGALLVWMANDRSPRGTSLNWWPDEGLWEACIGALDGEDSIAVMSAQPGRALALAALKAYGVGE